MEESLKYTQQMKLINVLRRLGYSLDEVLAVVDAIFDEEYQQ